MMTSPTLLFEVGDAIGMYIQSCIHPPLIRGGCDPAHAEHNKMMHGTHSRSEYEVEDLLLPQL